MSSGNLITVSNNSSIAHSFHNNLELKNTHCLSSKSKCAIMAFTVSGVAGVIIVALGTTYLFGAPGSLGFIASMAVGGALTCLAIGGVTWIVTTNCKNQKQATTICAPNNEEERRYKAQRDNFLTAAQERSENKPTLSMELPDCNEQEFSAYAKEAIECIFDRWPPPHIKNFGGGEHACVTTDKIPGVLFKKRRGGYGDPMTEHIKRADRARKICEDNNLYLLYVPQCKIVDFDQSVIVEEKVELLDGGRDSQKACYQWAISDPDLQPYIKELFGQKMIFTCLMKFSDMKYDNVPFMKDGRVALFDVDENSAIMGLTSGGARKGKDGLFNMLPLEWFDEFIEIAKKYLDANEFAELQKELPRLQEKAKRREKRMKDMGEFYASRHITSPTQRLVFQKKLFEKCAPEVSFFAEKAIHYLNQEISKLPLLSMIAGRQLSIRINIDDEFHEAIRKAPFFNGKTIYPEHFKKIAEAGLQSLKDQGYIFSYKLNTSYHFISIIC